MFDASDAFLARHHKAFAAVCPAVAALSAVALRYTEGWWLLGPAGLLLLGVLIPTQLPRLNALQQGREAAEECLRQLLVACAESFGHPAIHVRANVMGFTADRRRRQVQASTAFNMGDDPDRNLEIGATAGVSGEAVVQRKPAYGDASITLTRGGPSWGLEQAELRQVRPTLKSIVSAPILDPRAPRGDLLGTLQIDSDEPLHVTRFDSPEYLQLAERFADVVSLLMEVKRQ